MKIMTQAKAGKTSANEKKGDTKKKAVFRQHVDTMSKTTNQRWK